MDFSSWRLDRQSASWRTLKSHHEEVEEDEEEMMEVEDDEAAYPCPYCAEDFEDAELVEYHIQDAHPSKSDYDSETCPVCSVRVGTDMVEHLIVKHRDSLDMEQLLKLMKSESYLDSSSSYGKPFRGSSRTTSSEAEEALGKLLSFVCEVPPANEVQTVQPNLSGSVDSSTKKCPDEELVERPVPSPTLEEQAADKEARSRCDFVQTLAFSSLFDFDF